MKRTVFFVSCSTGITAETLGHTLLTQFEGEQFDQVVLPFVDTEEKVQHAVGYINRVAEQQGVRPLVFCTLVNPRVRGRMHEANGLVFDFFDTFIGRLEGELGQHATQKVGRSHGVGDTGHYTARIDAVNYALQSDDGIDTKHYNKADLILIGVSRTGKTPTCLYLALQFGIRAANYPLTEEDLGTDSLPEELRDFRGKLFGLTIAPQRLQEIRSERKPNSRYASLPQCEMEVRRAEAMFLNAVVPHIDTSSSSIEEIATTIVHRAHIARRLY